jgi:hypothetical protein
VERISEFEDREHFPQPWIAEEEAQGAPLGQEAIELPVQPVPALGQAGAQAADPLAAQQ